MSFKMMISAVLPLLLTITSAKTLSCKVTGQGTCAQSAELIDGLIDLHYVNNFVSESEVAKLINFCNSQPGRWSRSLTRSRIEGNNKMESVEGRLSDSCPLLFAYFYLPHAEKLLKQSPLLAEELEITWEITQRVAALLKVDKQRVEAIQLLRYAPGGEYQVHHDHTGWYKQTEAGNYETGGESRSKTMLLFLSEPESGGNLRFPYLNNSVGEPLEIQPRTGDAVYWSNVDEEGRPSPLALHAGLPVGPGQPKVVANVWIAEEPFTQMPMTSR